ncbi:MAG: hypothetical protein HUK01_08130 [Bacteroidaceae bacterium]|nr:hypothetical protein [Bacteroidaceae bacterium]
MKPFDLDAAKAGAAVCLRNGTPVRIICYDKKGHYPLVVLLPDRYGGEYDAMYEASGLYHKIGKSDFDLMMGDGNVEEKTIESLGLSKTLFMILKKNGVHTIAQLTQCTPTELLSFTRLGKKWLSEIQETLKEKGLTLTQDRYYNGY